MDKISAALMTAIAALVLISGVMAYDMWFADKHVRETKTTAVSAETMEELIFNDDTSIKNNSDKRLWIRVMPICEGWSDTDGCIVSRAVEQGRWKSSEEGWYYYFRPIGPEETTDPLVDRLLRENDGLMQSGSDGFSLRVEALDEAWVPPDTVDGMEAFHLLEDAVAIPENGKML